MLEDRIINFIHALCFGKTGGEVPKLNDIWEYKTGIDFFISFFIYDMNSGSAPNYADLFSPAYLQTEYPQKERCNMDDKDLPNKKTKWVARLLGVTICHVAVMCKDGVIPHYYIPKRKLRFVEREITEWLTEYHRV